MDESGKRKGEVKVADVMYHHDGRIGSGRYILLFSPAAETPKNLPNFPV